MVSGGGTQKLTGESTIGNGRGGADLWIPACIAGLCLLLGADSRAAEDWPGDPAPLMPVAGVPVYGFEHDVPVNFRPDPDSHLTLNHRWYRGAGDTSLRWDWDRAGGSFDILLPNGFPEQGGIAGPGIGTGVPRLLAYESPVFSAWLYQESARSGMVTFEVRSPDAVLHLFLVSLHFEGWKELRIPYRFGLPATADRLRVIAPPRGGSGTLYIDLLSTWQRMLVWRERPRRDGLWPRWSCPDLLIPSRPSTPEP